MLVGQFACLAGGRCPGCSGPMTPQEDPPAMNTSHAHSPVLHSALLHIAAIAICTSPALAQLPVGPSRVPTWERAGALTGAGPEVFSLAETAADPMRVYAGSSAGVLRSDDRGQSWALVSEHYPSYGFWFVLLASQLQPDLVLSLDYLEGVLRSVDGGVSWQPPSTPPGGAGVADIAQASNADRVYASTYDGVWRSDDGGDNFVQTLCSIDALGGTTGDLEVDPLDADHVYVGAGALGMFETTNGGSTWTQRSLPDSQASLAIHPSDGLRLLAFGDGISRSEDGGVSWTDISEPDGGPILACAFDPVDPQRLYTGFRYRAFAHSDDEGATWIDNADPGLVHSGGTLEAILPSSVHPGELLVGMVGGVYRSTDSGVTFERRNQGLDQYAAVFSIAASPFDPDHLVAKTGGSMFVSTDGGQVWTESVTGPAFFGNEVTADEMVPGRFYTSNWNLGMWRSDDGGHTFYRSSAYPAWFAQIASHPTIPDRVFAAGSGLHRSDDGGLTFTPLAPGGWLWALEVSHANPDVIYLSGGGMIYSHDGGDTWSGAASQPPEGIREIVAHPSDPLRAYATGNTESVYTTVDGGINWSLITGDFKGTWSLALSALDPEVMVSASWSGPSSNVSFDEGLTATEFRGGPNSIIWALASTTSGTFAGSWGHGVHIWR